jgi:hypothetical protein
VLPALTLPAWTARLVIVLVLAGFPIALILAWAFDVGARTASTSRANRKPLRNARPRFLAGAGIFSRLPSWAC